MPDDVLNETRQIRVSLVSVGISGLFINIKLGQMHSCLISSHTERQPHFICTRTADSHFKFYKCCTRDT